MAIPYPDRAISPIRDGTPVREDQTYLFGSADAAAFHGSFAISGNRAFDGGGIFNSVGTRNGEAIGETTDMTGVN